MQLIVGLGNPGREYEGTRHNVGFDVLSLLARQSDAPRPKTKFESELTEIGVGEQRLILLAPQTYMNLSGRAVRKALDFYQLEPAQLLVICDDLHLPLGRVRIREAGSSGGQKGLENIIQQLNTQAFCRLRVGIDSPPSGMNSAAFVLGKFSKSEQTAVESAVALAAEAARRWATEGAQAAMNYYNALKPE